jgi:4-amino-4-deoxy-L-arabinose transferase-like glycosyltransferase
VLSRIPASIYWTGLGTLLVAVALFVRPPLPVDETRYLAVAWEMWQRQDFLVPYLNGQTYSHKPPLLFWLMNLGWAVFGVNDWTPRLVAPLFGLACLFLTRRLARDLWPQDHRVHEMAPLILLGCGFWALFSTLTMFDLMLAFCALLGLVGIVSAWRRGGMGGFVLLALAIGLGALTKGPAILLHLLPVALLAPFWAGRLRGGPTAPLYGWGRWYLGVVLATLSGAAIGLAWAVPAGFAGGEEYRNAILWGQTAGRMVKSFAHQRPFWWYFAVVPALILPWLIWPPLLRALAKLERGAWSDGGLRLCLAWFGLAFVVFSLISGKQLHYLLPEFPALALVFAYALTRTVWQENRFYDRALPGLLVIMVGLLILVVPVAHLIPREPDWISLIHNLWGLPVMVGGGWLIAGRFDSPEPRVIKIVLAPVIVVVGIHLAAKPALDAVYDLRPFAHQLKIWEDEGRPLANFGKYHGQYQYLGRLTKPMAVMGQKEGDEDAFLLNNPGGRIVAYYKSVPTRAKPLATYRFRQITIAVWDTKTMLEHPNLGDRR